MFKTNYQAKTLTYDVVVVGGGMSGLCAAIASARHGAKTALIQDRPVLGGNAGSEIRVNISGANHHGRRPDARETGIIEEILLENLNRNPQVSFSVFDTILWEKARFQENLDLFLNCHMNEVLTDGRAITYSEEDLANWPHRSIGSGYWWIELGGVNEDIIDDAETIRDELLKAVYGIWDHIKNGGDHGAENYALDWVGSLPGKRESRRIVGDYILKAQDLMEGRIFEDAVSFGGWSLDIHCVDGLRNPIGRIDHPVPEDVYTIPYRSLYARDLDNLFLGGRAISASHSAFGSIRVMATCAVNGQAVGTAAAMCIEMGVPIRGLSAHITELQQTLLRDDCYIPGYVNEDVADLARSAEITCSSALAEGAGSNVINGIARRVKERSNCWISEAAGLDGEWIELNFSAPIHPKELHLKFDTNLSTEIAPSLFDQKKQRSRRELPETLVKDYRVEYLRGDRVVESESVRDNHQRLAIHRPEIEIECDRIRITVSFTYGDPHARIFEVRVY